MESKKKYIQPSIQIIKFSGEVLSAISNKRGYAIDNFDADNNNIIDVQKSTDMNYWNDVDLD